MKILIKQFLFLSELFLCNHIKDKVVMSNQGIRALFMVFHPILSSNE